ncbi:MAG: DUF2069 domain-containing protein [Pseudomonadales bacterium]|nr:DUF2069 domain-containing protein [Pseudomonadales bacterium]
MTSVRPQELLLHSRRLVHLCYALILICFLLRAAWDFMQAQSLTVTLFLLVIQIGPLLIFLPGLRKDHLRSHAWLSFAILMYFIYAVLTAFTAGTFWYGLVLSLLTGLLFSALVAHIHFSRKLLGRTLQ